MGKFSMISDNPMKTKKDMAEAFQKICEPIHELYSPGKALLHIANFSAAYEDEIAQMEGFSRILWGMIPLFIGGGHSELLKDYLIGIKNGTDPNHPEYWGEIHDYDQRMVEMAVYGYALALIPEKIWEPLSQEEKHNLSAWLFQINRHIVFDCNWIFFRILINCGLKKVGEPYDATMLEKDLNRIDEFYVNDGWYTDGVNAHSDYYCAFAMHYYGLIYSVIIRDEDPKRCEVFRQRATEFAKSFIDWFSDDGSALPYGRSLTYKFAQCAFWGAAAYAGITPFSPGVIKGIVMRNLRWWFKQPIFRADGTLSVGYCYPNMFMSESYNSPGSPYWGLKAFIPLALADDSAFWQAEEEPLPQRPTKIVQLAPHFVICRDGDHIVAFNGGNEFADGHTHTSSKYEKFAYSNLFGFSIPRGEYGLSQGAFDSMLAVSDGDDIFRAKRFGTLIKLTKEEIVFQWKPWSDVTVKTHILPGLPWHIRVHEIETGRKLKAADSGFAICQNNFIKDLQSSEKDGTAAITGSGTTGIRNLFGNGKFILTFPDPDTNIISSRTLFPTVIYELQPGRHVIADAVFASKEKCDGMWTSAPCSETFGNLLRIYDKPNGKKIFEIEIGC